VDDDEAARLSIAQMLMLRGFTVESFSSAETTLAWPGLRDAACVVCDVKMPGLDGEEFLAEAKRRDPAAMVILITGHGDVPMAVRCLKAGAYDFVEKPFEDEVLLASVGRAVERAELQRESKELRRQLQLLPPIELGAFGMIGRSRLMQELWEQIEIAARSAAPVLIVGETGTGKELVARAIHGRSDRSGRPFVAVNAGGLPESMVESELFGHVRGAFTGADAKREGRLVTASGGTLLLDEVECISASAQVKLLRVLEDGEVYPLGTDRLRKVDVRLLATTKIDLKEQVRLDLMREDFFHRIMVLSITVPPLRQRREDIPLLTAHFLKSAAARNGIAVPEIPEETLSRLLQCDWPGNVRELRNSVERMVITARKGVAGPFTADQEGEGGRLISLPPSSGRLRDEMERTEKHVIEMALRESGGRLSTACLALGISRRALYERMKKYALKKEEYRD